MGQDNQLEIAEQRIIDITTSTTNDRCNSARLVIDESERQGLSLTATAALQIEVDGQTGSLFMTADELGKIGQKFVDIAESMK